MTLLCPQHWADVSGDDEDGTFYTAPGSFNYRAFEATYLAMDASHLRQQTVSFNNLHPSVAREPLDPAEFIANEDINRSSHSDLDPLAECPIHPTGHHKWGECSHNPINVLEERGPLQFSPTPIRDDAELDNDAISASDDQAELLRWHCRLGHISR